MAEAIEPPGQALFIFEIEHEADALTPELDEGIGVTVCFIERGGRPSTILRGSSPGSPRSSCPRTRATSTSAAS